MAPALLDVQVDDTHLMEAVQAKVSAALAPYMALNPKRMSDNAVRRWSNEARMPDPVSFPWIAIKFGGKARIEGKMQREERITVQIWLFWYATNPDNFYGDAQFVGPVEVANCIETAIFEPERPLNGFYTRQAGEKLVVGYLRAMSAPEEFAPIINTVQGIDANKMYMRMLLIGEYLRKYDY